MQSITQYLINWNNRFPKDHAYRKKYNIGFLSPQHKELNQIDIFFDIIEQQLIEYYTTFYRQRAEDLEEYKKTGNFIKEHRLSELELKDLFDKLDVTELNEKNG